MRCKYCLAENSEDCVYCPACGNLFVAQESQVPSQSAAVSVEILSVTRPVSVPEDSLDGTDYGVTTGADDATLKHANLFRLRKSWDQAIALCVQVLKDRPADPAAHSLLGDIYRDQGRLDEAVRWYRMAVELQPNPFDLANLQKLEKRMAVRGSAATPAGANSSNSAGITGISPQRWLRGVTISAVTLLSVFVAYLLFVPQKKLDSLPGTSGSMQSASNSGDGLPPVILGGSPNVPVNSRASNNGQPVHTAGTGLAPDIGNSTVEAALPSTPAVPGSNLSPAPVKSIAPLQSAPGQISEMNHGDPRSQGSGSSSLQGGMQIANIAAAHGVATISVTAPQDTDVTANREIIVRNIYRAARTAFGNDTTIGKATVSVEAGGTLVLSADIDRVAALASDPDHDDLGELDTKLQYR